MQNLTSVQDILQKGYSFTPVEALKDGFQVLRQKPWLFIGYISLLLFASAMLGMVPYLGSIITNALFFPLSICGIALGAIALKRGDSPNLLQLLPKQEQVLALGFYGILQSGVLLLVSLPILLIAYQKGLFTWYSDFQQAPDKVFNVPEIGTIGTLIFLLNLIPIIYLSIAMILGPLFILFYRMDPMEALQTSIRVVSIRWVSFLMLSIYFVGIGIFAGLIASLSTAVLGMLGAFAMVLFICGFLAWLHGSFFQVFAEISGLNKPSDEPEDIDPIDHFIED